MSISGDSVFDYLVIVLAICKDPHHKMGLESTGRVQRTAVVNGIRIAGRDHVEITSPPTPRILSLNPGKALATPTNRLNFRECRKEC